MPLRNLSQPVFFFSETTKSHLRYNLLRAKDKCYAVDLKESPFHTLDDKATGNQ